MALTVADFLADPRFEEFDSLDETLIASELAYVATLLPEGSLCVDEMDEGRKYYLAHLLTLDQTGQLGGRAIGQISSISGSQGSQSVSFAATDGKAEANQLSATKWGLRLQALMANSACRFVTGFVV
ncbi:DUF4054 domain-containing protein [Phormidium sp. FACHB-592]|uniref:DUF4054 domain-containing protein n=1 Tax=Stenomitos frigidus AS-A4 TaxID=2933935 RepID=A0ABV0KEG5_9CYAN|nr:DUF4054 domain-containing protein [Phormidium sp. FACHB-592]MBD2076205.1 DUF4054 domain-containing protein [Phormidium sp. FACHB-592]